MNILISNRSKFFNLEAMGVNTSDIESLTSYISRLSKEHNISVGIFLSKGVLPYISSKKLQKEVQMREHNSIGLNNHHARAKEFSEVIGELTTNNDIELLTLIKYEKILPSYELTSLKKWCPSCLLNWKRKNNIIYHKLIWAFDTVEICPKHKCKLAAYCFKCGSVQYPLHPRGIEGYCQKCFAFLGNEDIESVTNNNGYFDWQKWVVDNVGSLLSLNTCERLKVNERFESMSLLLKKYLNNIKETTGFSQVNVAKLAKIGRSSICDWQKERNYPSLFSLLKLCYICQVSLLEFYKSEYKIPITFKKLPLYIQESATYKNKQKYDTEYLIESLIAIADGDYSPPPSLLDVAKQFGYSNSQTLRVRFPEESRIIIDKNKKYKEELTKMKNEKIYGDIKSQIIRFLQQGSYPGLIKIEKALNKPALFRKKLYKDMVKQLFKELGVIQKLPRDER